MDILPITSTGQAEFIANVIRSIQRDPVHYLQNNSQLYRDIRNSQDQQGLMRELARS